MKIILLAKLLAIAAVIVSLWVRQLEFEIGVAALALVNLGLAGVLVLAATAGLLGRRRT